MGNEITGYFELENGKIYYEPPAAQRLGEVHAPVLIITGELDNPELVRAAEVMAAGIPGAKKVILPGCAHLLNMERPEEFNRIVLEFLAEIKNI